MDKRSYFGMLLIGLVLIMMFYWTSQPKADKAKQQKYEQQQTAAREAADQAAEQETVLTVTANDSLMPLFPAMNGQEQSVVIANSLVKVSISTKGGAPASAELLEYRNQQGSNVILFDKSEISMNFKLDGKTQNISTSSLFFEPVNVSGNSVTMRLNTLDGGHLDYCYTLAPESYMVDLKIQAHGMQNFFPSDLDRMSVDWIQNLRQQEKGFEFEQRYTTLTYKMSDKAKSKYLAVTSTPRSQTLDEPVDWIAFKNQFFSTIMIADQSFDADAKLSASAYAKGKGYMKKMMARTHLQFDPDGKEATSIQFYFGPNDYKVLKATGRKFSPEGKKLRLHRVIDLGWPIVREVNRYIIIPLFNLLSGWGINMGIVLLLLTIIIKIIVYPFTYKSYVSSAKMRALKPYVDEINQKYPKPEDAMKKQQETMAVYSKYGVSPMGGCIPSLIQMPVWMALFFFVPNAIELRQQSFLWATDLTAFDDILSWNAKIPMIGTHLSIFCVLFCVTNLLNTFFTMKQQQNMAPGQEESMKMMRWMMYLMPLIFFFTLNNYSSGLNYYYFISALSSVLIMVYLRRTTDEKKLLAQLEARYEARKNDPKKSRSNSMMARLEALQKEQERLQNR